MRKYTVTTADGTGPMSPEDRASFETEKAATDDAQNALADMARDAFPDGSHARFEASVEDDTGDQVYRASLEFNAQGRDEIAGDEAENERALAKFVRTLRDDDK
jgi:hypothetical protein